jgi:hypothetical protein
VLSVFVLIEVVQPFLSLAHDLLALLACVGAPKGTI